MTLVAASRGDAGAEVPTLRCHEQVSMDRREVPVSKVCRVPVSVDHRSVSVDRQVSVDCRAQASASATHVEAPTGPQVRWHEGDTRP
jgi:hypothetical protein